MNESIQVIIVTAFTFSTLLLYTRILGKKQMGQLTYFNYITGITVGSLCANIIMIFVKTFGQGLLALSVWFMLTIVLGIITLKSIIIKALIDGESTIVIENGKLKLNALRKLRLNINDLSMLLRKKDIFSLSDVDYAVFESNGNLSILKDINKRNVTKQDLNIVVATPKYVPTVVITDGRFHDKKIKKAGLTKQWILKQLNESGFDSLTNITYVELQEDGKLFIDYK